MKTRNISKNSVAWAVALLMCACLTAPAQDYRVLRVFSGGASDGATPWGPLVQSGSALYGMTSEGGTNNAGTVFRINTDGAGFQILHSFVSGASDGEGPIGPLLPCGTILYGMAACAGTSYGGTLFQINTDGTGFQVLRSFSVADGMWPWDSLIQSGSILYGLNTYGGSASGWSGKGTIFQINTNGSGFRILRTFAGGAADGQGPHGSFVQSGSVLYATTLSGGTNDAGTVFCINIDGTGFQLLHSFGPGASNGTRPYTGALVLSGSTLYGMTGFGGGNNLGTIFKLNTDGTGFTVLRSFAGGGVDGAAPRGSLVLSGSTLYGMTRDGGASSRGTVFEIQTNGTGFRLLHNFAGGSGDGAQPYGSLLLCGTTLYGMASSESNGQNKGVIFALDLFPKISITSASTNVTLSWSSNYPGFTLESTGDLTGGWTTVSGVTGYSATLPVSADSQFFRLRQ